MHLRLATWRDAWTLRTWRNDPSTYRYFKSARPVGHWEHLRWILRELPKELTFMAVECGDLVGVCRLSPMTDGPAYAMEISITVAPLWRCRHYGRDILGLVIREAQQLGIRLLYADIMERNTASRALFESQGFNLVATGRPLRYRRVLMRGEA